MNSSKRWLGLIVGLGLLAWRSSAWAEPLPRIELPEDQSGTWADVTVDQVAGYLDNSIDWFDGFFADERYLEEKSARLWVLWRNDFIYDLGEDGFEFKTRLRARAKVPNLSQRVKLLLTSKEADALGDEDQVGSFSDEREAKGSIGLSYDVQDSLLEHLSLAVNLRGSPFEAIFKLRHRQSWGLSELINDTLTSTLYWNTREGIGGSLRNDFDRRWDEDSFMRWSSQLEASNEFSEDGVQWYSSLTNYRKLRDNRAVAYSVGMEGVTRPDVQADKYWLQARFRRNVYRRWLFLELAPEIYWPQDERREECETCFLFLTRLEVLFDRGD